MPPTTDQLDTDYKYILAATLSACRAKNLSVQTCAAFPVVAIKKGGFVTFNAEISEEKILVRKFYDTKERMEEWLDYFIDARALTKDKTVFVYICKTLVGAGMPGISVNFWNE